MAYCCACCRLSFGLSLRLLQAYPWLIASLIAGAPLAYCVAYCRRTTRPTPRPGAPTRPSSTSRRHIYMAYVLVGEAPTRPSSTSHAPRHTRPPPYTAPAIARAIGPYMTPAIYGARDDSARDSAREKARDAMYGNRHGAAMAPEGAPEICSARHIWRPRWRPRPLYGVRVCAYVRARAHDSMSDRACVRASERAILVCLVSAFLGSLQT